MKSTGRLAVFAALIFSLGNVLAVPPGKTLEFASPMGKVTFDGKAHADQGLKCADCHTKPKLFGMKKGSDKINMAAMNDGKFCGACHDGGKAFGVKAQADCVKCHKKGGTEAKADAKAEAKADAKAEAKADAKAEAAGASKPAKEETSTAASKQGSAGKYIDDAVITAKVKAAIMEAPTLKSAEINVETSKGRVQLTGFVSSRADINNAVKVAKKIKGVKSVKNDMILKGTQ